MLDKHGLRMKNVKQASCATVDWRVGSGGHTQISYNTKTGEILTTDHVGNSRRVYDDPNIITVCHTADHMTMQEIADMIFKAVQLRSA